MFSMRSRQDETDRDGKVGERDGQIDRVNGGGDLMVAPSPLSVVALARPSRTLGPPLQFSFWLHNACDIFYPPVASKRREKETEKGAIT